MPHLSTPILITIYSVIVFVLLVGASVALTLLGKFLADESPEVYDEH